MDFHETTRSNEVSKHYEFAGQPEYPNFDVARNLQLCKQESSQTLYCRVKYAILNVT